MPATDSGTVVEIEHRGWERLGVDADTWHDRNRMGWTTLLRTSPAPSGRREPLSTCHEGDHDTPSGTKEDPWQLSTAPAWLVEQRDWVDPGAADELKPAKEGTVEAFGRSADNPVGGWYGLRKGYRGRFGVYVPPLLEGLGGVELTHDPATTKCAR